MTRCQFLAVKRSTWPRHIELDAWKGARDGSSKTSEQIRETTNSYLETEEARRQIQESAKLLVETSKTRSQREHFDLWEKFVHGVEYVCEIEDCPEESRS